MQLGWVDVAGTHASGVLNLDRWSRTPEACVPALAKLTSDLRWRSNPRGSERTGGAGHAADAP